MGVAGARTYDVTLDDPRFLMVRAAQGDTNTEAPSLIVVQHFDQELKAKVPVR